MRQCTTVMLSLSLSTELFSRDVQGDFFFFLTSGKKKARKTKKEIGVSMKPLLCFSALLFLYVMAAEKDESVLCGLDASFLPPECSSELSCEEAVASRVAVCGANDTLSSEELQKARSAIRGLGGGEGELLGSFNSASQERQQAVLAQLRNISNSVVLGYFFVPETIEVLKTRFSLISDYRSTSETWVIAEVIAAKLMRGLTTEQRGLEQTMVDCGANLRCTAAVERQVAANTVLYENAVMFVPEYWAKTFLRNQAELDHYRASLALKWLDAGLGEVWMQIRGNTSATLVPLKSLPWDFSMDFYFRQLGKKVVEKVSSLGDGTTYKDVALAVHSALWETQSTVPRRNWTDMWSRCTWILSPRAQPCVDKNLRLALAKN